MSTPIRHPLRSMNNNESETKKPHTSFTKETFETPSKKNKGIKRSGAKIMSSLKKKGGKLRRALTPPRGLNVGCAKTPVRTKTPLPLTFSPKFQNADAYQIKTSEHDPSKFQVEVPTQAEILKSAKICAVMDNYVELGGVDFDFSSLMPFGGASPDINSLLLAGNINSIDENAKNDIGKSKNIHPILSKLQDAESDLVVEGFYREHAGDDIGRVEVVIFSSQSSRQMFIVYRGSSKLQDRPTHSTKIKSKAVGGNKGDEQEKQEDDCRDDDDTLVVANKKSHNINDIINSDVNETVVKAYNDTNLEESIFTILNRLIGFKPFNDVSFIGHSFGGALATIAAIKYASQKPASMVRCHVFGCPQIGGLRFRNEAHSLPNLSIVRTERNTDPFVSAPVSDSNMAKCRPWTHVGHCLKINQGQMLTQFATSDDTRPVDIRLYRFDKLRPPSTFVTSSVTSVCNFSKLKIGNEIRSYVKDLDKVTSLNLKWPETFAGQLPETKSCLPTGYLA